MVDTYTSGKGCKKSCTFVRRLVDYSAFPEESNDYTSFRDPDDDDDFPV